MPLSESEIAANAKRYPFCFRIEKDPVTGEGRLVANNLEEHKRFVASIFDRFGPQPDFSVDMRAQQVPHDIC